MVDVELRQQFLETAIAAGICDECPLVLTLIEDVEAPEGNYTYAAATVRVEKLGAICLEAPCHGSLANGTMPEKDMTTAENRVERLAQGWHGFLRKLLLRIPTFEIPYHCDLELRTYRDKFRQRAFNADD